MYIRQKYRHVDDFIPARAGFFQNELDIAKNGVALGGEIIGFDAAIFVQFDAGDFFCAAFTGADAGEKKKIAGAARMGIGADRFGSL